MAATTLAYLAPLRGGAWPCKGHGATHPSRGFRVVKNNTAAERRVHLANRLALRPKEAAEALGIGERTLRQILPGIRDPRVARTD